MYNPIILIMPKHENITDLRKSLTEENNNDTNIRKDRFCPCFLCIIVLGVAGLTTYMIHQSVLIENGSM